MKTKLLIILAAILVIAIGGTVVGASIANSPENVAASSIASIFTDFLAREEIKPLCDTLTQGSIGFSVDSVKPEAEEGESVVDYLKDSSVSGKLYFSKEALMLSDFEAKFKDIKFAGDVYVSENLIYVNEENVLEGAYGVEIKSFAEDLADSIFAPDSNSKYALDEDTYDQIIEMLDALSESSENNEAMQKDAEKLFEKLFKDLWDIVADNAEIESESEEIRLGGEKTKVRLITIVINDKAMENIINDVYDYLCESDDIVDFLEKYEDSFAPMANLINRGMINGEKDISLAEKYEEALEDAEDYIDDLCDSISSDFEDITIEIATPKMKSTLLKLEVKVGKVSVIVVDCGQKGIKETDTIKIEVLDEFDITYSVKQNDKKAFEAELTIGEDEDIVVSLSIDKKKGDYNATVEVSDNYYDSYTQTTVKNKNKFIVKGDYDESGDTTTMTVDKIIFKEDDDEFTIDVSATLTIDTNDKIPSAPKDYDTISDITEEDIETWMKNIEKMFSLPEAAPEY